MKKLTRCAAVTAIMSLAMVFALSSVSQAATSYMDKTTSAGQYRIYYNSTLSASCEAIVLGVGTAMSRDSYDNLASAVAAYGYVVVIMDHQPGSMTKTGESQYKACIVELQSNLLTWISGKGCTSIAHWILGGHSAGGQAAQNTVADNPGIAQAIFSIDPYDCSSTGSVSVPALYWGFNVTTCFVTKESAAMAAYDSSLGYRAFYRVASVYSWGPCGYSPKYFHCSFTDGDCPACTNCMTTPSYFFTDVAKSVNKFINASFYGTFTKANVAVSTTTPTVLFVGSETP